jgi:hypothetical protein
VLTEVVDREDVGMAEGGDSLGFLLKTAEALGIARERGRKDFEGNVAVEAGIARAIHLSHASGSERGEDFIRA